MEQVFQAYVLEMKGRGKGVFLSSHIMSEVERLCDRVGIIRNGELVQVGTLDELRHLTRYAMTVTTERPLEGLESLPGVFNVHQEQHGMCFHVDVDKMGSVVNHINQFGIKKLDSSPPTLEELFMQHYNRADSEPQPNLQSTVSGVLGSDRTGENSSGNDTREDEAG
jgi:ABC-2 type transport system ATP-binding protein